ncbi:MAG: RDD family protein [Tumebacillaceae bacterium]
MTTLRFGGFGERFVALLIDGILLFVVNLILGFIGLSYLSFIVGWLYFAFMESSDKQGTFGKQVMKLKVTDTDGNRISFGRATGRYFSKYISALILCIGYLMAAFTEKKQALHDMIAGTLVYTNAPVAVRDRDADFDRSWSNDTNDINDNSSIDFNSSND